MRIRCEDGYLVVDSNHFDEIKARAIESGDLEEKNTPPVMAGGALITKGWFSGLSMEQFKEKYGDGLAEIDPDSPVEPGPEEPEQPKLHPNWVQYTEKRLFDVEQKIDTLLYAAKRALDR